MSRIYTSVVSVGNVNIYQVSGDPNGSLEAPQGSLAIDDAAALYQNTDGGTTWSGVGGAFYPQAVILRPAGPQDADNVYLTAAEARAALNAGSGQRVFAVQAPLGGFVDLDAGTYGDGDVIMVGLPPFDDGNYNQAELSSGAGRTTVRLAYGAILPMRRFQNLGFDLNAGGAYPQAPAVATSNEYYFKNVLIATSNVFTPPNVPFFQVPSGVAASAYVSGVRFALDGAFEVDGTGAVSRLEMWVYGATAFMPTAAFGASSTIRSTGANARLQVFMGEEVYTLSGIGSGNFGGIPAFTVGGGVLQDYAINKRYATGTQAPNVILAPGAAGALPALDEVPDNFKITFTPDAAAGANATVSASGADLLLPADPVSLAVGESATFMRAPVNRTGGGTPFWTTV